MGVIRNIADRIELYDPRTGERFFHYDETADEISADKPLNADSVNTDDLYKTNIGPVVFLSAEQSIPSGSITPVEFDTILGSSDKLNEFDTSIGSFTAARGGDYEVDVQLQFSDDLSEGTDTVVDVEVNGQREIRYQQTVGSLSGATVSAHRRLIDLSEGDTITVSVFHNEGSSVNLFASAVRCWADIQFVG